MVAEYLHLAYHDGGTKGLLGETANCSCLEGCEAGFDFYGFILVFLLLPRAFGGTLCKHIIILVNCGVTGRTNS